MWVTQRRRGAVAMTTLYPSLLLLLPLLFFSISQPAAASSATAPQSTLLGEYLGTSLDESGQLADEDEEGDEDVLLYLLPGGRFVLGDQSAGSFDVVSQDADPKDNALYGEVDFNVKSELRPFTSPCVFELVEEPAIATHTRTPNSPPEGDPPPPHRPHPCLHIRPDRGLRRGTSEGVCPAPALHLRLDLCPPTRGGDGGGGGGGGGEAGWRCWRRRYGWWW